jgi:hypothetical protein
MGRIITEAIPGTGIMKPVNELAFDLENNHRQAVAIAIYEAVAAVTGAEADPDEMKLHLEERELPFHPSIDAEYRWKGEVVLRVYKARAHIVDGHLERVRLVEKVWQYRKDAANG